MSNIENNGNCGVTLIGKTIIDNNNNFTSLEIPMEFAKELHIENSKVLMSIVNDIDGSRHLIITKFQREIVIS